ncbi:MAG: hypothetical protein K0R89_1293 [Ramlibacter sp.]|jgi:hypothetical protein|nr:hypothetical protein [Ramlibacter sp.]
MNIPTELAHQRAEEISRLVALPDEALLTTHEAAAVLRLRRTTLAWHRSQGGGPEYVHVGSRVRYRMGALRAYMKGARNGR